MALIYLGAINQYSVGKVLDTIDSSRVNVDEDELKNFVEKLINMSHGGCVSMGVVETIF